MESQKNLDEDWLADDLVGNLRFVAENCEPPSEGPDLISLMQDAATQIERLARWKREASEMLTRWDDVFQSIGPQDPSNLGRIQSDLVKEHIERLVKEIKYWKTEVEVARRLFPKSPGSVRIDRDHLGTFMATPLKEIGQVQGVKLWVDEVPD